MIFFYFKSAFIIRCRTICINFYVTSRRSLVHSIHPVSIGITPYHKALIAELLFRKSLPLCTYLSSLDDIINFACSLSTETGFLSERENHNNSSRQLIPPLYPIPVVLSLEHHVLLVVLVFVFFDSFPVELRDIF